MTRATPTRTGPRPQWQISWKNALRPNEAAHLASDEISSAAALLYMEYDKTLQGLSGVDFDDLIRHR